MLCWGWTVHGALEIGDDVPPVRLEGLSAVRGLNRVQTITAGDLHFSCALESVGEVRCWGDNAFGQLGNGGLSDAYSAVKIPSIGPFGERWGGGSPDRRGPCPRLCGGGGSNSGVLGAGPTRAAWGMGLPTLVPGRTRAQWWMRA